ncbi:MAG: ABC transporter ATP-binding protein [Micrococcales bacterium]|nr:ABC transporter ATP-binding protein [Micrococcales bacterium]
MTVPAVVADDLSLAYSRRPATRPAVDGVSLTIPRGGILALLGEAGAGKSTFARALSGQIGRGVRGAPVITGGSLTVLGHEVRGMSRRTRDELTLRVGYLPQDAGSELVPWFTVGENIAEPIYSRDRRFDRLEAGELVAALVDEVRLPLSVMEKFPHELSRGQRQRVALAKSLILEPQLLVADDPTMGVDVLVRGPILDVVADVQRERGFSVLVIGHDLRELRAITDRVAVLQDGALVGLGQVDSVLARPLHPYVRELAALTRRPLHSA